MIGNCKHTTYKIGHDCGDGANGIVSPTLFSHYMFVQMRFFFYPAERKMQFFFLSGLIIYWTLKLATTEAMIDNGFMFCHKKKNYTTQIKTKLLWRAVV
jgi:hypothetical protein